MSMQVTAHERLRRLLGSSHSEEIREKMLGMVSQTGALLEGHFQLQSGLHSSHLIRFGNIGWERKLTKEVAAALVEIAPFAREATAVVCPETAGVFLGKALAEQLELPLAVTAVDAHRRPVPELRTGRLEDEHRLLVVNDVITTGRSLDPILQLGNSCRGIAGVLCFATLQPDRAEQLAAHRGFPLEWLVFSTWRPVRQEDCDRCAVGEPFLPAAEFN
jgi:orotate phosphoribosyltransferase